MYSEERRHEIMTRLQREGRVSAVALAEEFEVTGETLRKDLIALEQLGLLKRTHGGAIAIERGGFELYSPAPRDLHSEHKAAVARRAAEHIRDMDTVLIGHGTTTSPLPRFVSYDLDLRVVTDSLDIQNGFLGHPKVTTMSIGGILRPSAHSYVGPWAVRSLSDIRVDLAVMGVAGVSAGQGLAASDALDAEVKRHMVKAAKRLIVVANSEKIGVEHFHRFADLDNIDVLITNDNVPEDLLAPLREQIGTIELV